MMAGGAGMVAVRADKETGVDKDGAADEVGWAGPITCYSRQIMARLGIEPRIPEYIPGALLTELPSHRYQTGLPLFVTTLCEQIAHPTHPPNLAHLYS